MATDIGKSAPFVHGRIVPAARGAGPIPWSSSDVLARPGRGDLGGGAHAPAEVAERATLIEAALGDSGAGGRRASTTTRAAAVHARLVDYLERLGPLGRGGYPELGAGPVVPYVFPSAGLVGPCGARDRGSACRVGACCYDTMTLVGPGTWEAARGAVDATLTAVDPVVGGASQLAYALVPTAGTPRRPGRRTAARATSTTPPSRRRRCGTPVTSAWPSSTSTRTTATAPRRSSTNAQTSLRVAACRPRRRLVPALRRLRRRTRRGAGAAPT